MTLGLSDNLSSLDVYMLLYDNIGFREKAGYQQYTALQWIPIKKEKLRQWGIYPKQGETMDDIAFSEGAFAGKSYAQLREKEHNWEEECNNISFDEIHNTNVSTMQFLVNGTSKK